jgi:hypothetical protein
MEEKITIKEETCEVLIKTEEIVPFYDADKFNVEPMEENPWAVDSLSKFLFYNCPECDFKFKDEPSFQNHAVELHYQVQYSIDKSGRSQSAWSESARSESAWSESARSKSARSESTRCESAQTERVQSKSALSKSTQSKSAWSKSARSMSAWRKSAQSKSA